MGRTLAKYSAVLIATYLVVYWGTNAGAVVTAGASGASSVVRAFQGRT